MIRLTIPGEPIGKARPRVYPVKMRSGRVVHRGVTPEKTVRFETQIRERFASVYPNHVPLTCAVRMEVRAFFSIPRSASVARAESMRQNRIHVMKRPDVDNCLKIVADALSGLAYRDDAQIIWADIRKQYSETPRLEITVSELGGGS